MSLSCECGDPYDSDWWYYQPNDFVPLFKARTTCCSCKKPIKVSEECLEFERAELGMFGDEILMKPLFMCESCGEIYLNITDLGYCIYLGDDSMVDLLEEYHELTGWEE